jgi:hypothetical protein
VGLLLNQVFEDLACDELAQVVGGEIVGGEFPRPLIVGMYGF